MKRILSISLVFFWLVLITGCDSDKKIEKKIKEDEAPLIGMTFDTFVVERWQRDRDVFVSKAKEFGAEVNVQNANGDVAKQISQIQYFIDIGAEVIVIVSIDSLKLTEVINKAKSEGIKIIAYDRLILGSEPDLYISFDNEEIGNLMGQAITECLEANVQGEKGKVVMVAGPTNDNNVSLIETGFRKKMEKANIEITDVINLEGWKAELAGEYINTNIHMISEVQAIMCGNDNLANEVVRVLSENRLAGKICVVGQDADLEACQRIVEGTQYSTVYKPVEHLASIAAQYAVQMAKGNSIDVENRINNGKYDIPYVSLKPYLVKFDNIDELIIDSGYHLKEDVYLNRPDLMKKKDN